MDLTISGIAPAPGGSGVAAQINIVISIPTPIGSVVRTALASGFNQFTIPTGTTVVIFQAPIGNATALTIKGVTGDTGLLEQPAAGLFIFMPTSGQTTFGMTAGGVIAALSTITYL